MKLQRLTAFVLAFKTVLVASFMTERLVLHSPCNFDPRCLCSVGAAEYGSVICDGVPLSDIPIELQESRVFQLKLRNNQLYRFPDAKLSGSGMWGLEVSHNPVTEIPSMAFYGLERALWELNLSNNRLTRVPTDSISILKKLSVLILADNMISELRSPDLRPVSTSLKVLDLSGNSLTSVPEGIFWNLQRLEVLDLSRNNILQIHSMAFQNGVPLLSELRLSDNLMGKIPFVSLEHLSSLRILDLSKNRIEKIEDPFFTSKIHLDFLDLSENNFRTINPNAFQNFNQINKTSLARNPLRSIETDAFEDANIRHLDVSNGYLDIVFPDSFRGLEKNLESLDLSGNRLKELPEGIFDDFDFLKFLRLDNNMLLSLSPNTTFNGFRYTMKELNIQGEDMTFVPLEQMGILRNLRTVSIKKKGSIEESCFTSFPPSLEYLDLSSSEVTTITARAFKHIPSISGLDLSDNRIRKIDDSAFKDVGNSLQHLKMQNALHFRRMPNVAFHCLTGLISLDLANNHIQDVPLDSFHKMTRIEQLFLQDNEISDFKRGTFHSQANPNLRILDLSFNRIAKVEMDTFRFPEMQKLLLNDNRIKKLSSRSFVEMTQLDILALQGNLIEHLPDETFQNLHRLSELNLSFNRLRDVNFAAFDSVGTLGHLSIDLSHNNVNVLKVNRSQAFPTLSNIMKLDMSHNNISRIEATFFEPVRNELKILNLSRNRIAEISPDDVGQLKRLFDLDLSHNELHLIEQTTFMAARGLKSIRLNQNRLDHLNPMLFNSQTRLQYVDMSDNQLQSIPEQLFQRTDLEMFLAANNQLTEIPVKALNPVQSTLKYLDLSGNRISTISDSQLNQIQLLVVIKLAKNMISSIDRDAFCCVPNLQYLDLSFNPILRIDPSTFLGVEAHLQFLNLANTSLTLLPNLRLPKLKALNISKNLLTFVPTNTLANLSEVRELDLSFNELPAPPSSAWHSMHHLRSLSLSGNPINRITNDSFVGLKHLLELDIARIPAHTFQVGSFETMPNLRSLKLQLHPQMNTLNLASMLASNPALEHLTIQISPKISSSSSSNPDSALLRHLLQDKLPKRLRHISMEGEVVANLHPASFKQLRSRSATLSFTASHRLDLDRDLFLNLGQVQNLSLEILGPQVGNVFNFSTHFMGERRLGNPITSYSPHHPRAVFLENLSIGGNQWLCTCDGIGWTEKWLRRWRGSFCSHSSDFRSHDNRETCDSILNTFRSASCQGTRKSLLQELKERLECDAFSDALSTMTKSKSILVWITTVFIVMVTV